LLSRARTRLGDARGWADARTRIGQLKDFHGEAVFFGSDFTGLEVPDNLARTRRAAAAGLALFGVVEGGDGPLVLNPRFFSPAEAAAITDRCYELLLLDVGALARPLPGEPADAWRSRVRDGLVRLDRAGRLLANAGPTRSGELRRAELYAHLGETDRAASAREVAAATAPRLAADYFLEALGFYRQDEFTRAIDPLSTVLRDDPDHYGAEYLLAVCRLRGGQHQAAREGLTRCLNRRPGFPWPRLLRGYAAMELRQWADARSDFEAVLTDAPDPVAGYVARVNRGVLAMRQSAWPAAEADFRAAVLGQPRAPATYLNLALTLQQGAAAEAWRTEALALGGARHPPLAVVAAPARRDAGRRAAGGVLDEAIANCPPDARLHHERAQLRLSLGDSGRAREDFRQAVALAANRGAAGTLADDLIELGRLLHQNREYEEAVRTYRVALAVRPDRAVAWRLMAPPLLALKRHGEARAALDEYIRTVPVAPGRPPSAGQAGELADALRSRGQVLAEEALAFRARGLLATAEGSARAALETYSRGLGLVRDPETLTLRGWTYPAANAPELALADFDEALRRRPGAADPLLGRASTRVLLREPVPALADAEAGLRLAPADAWTCYHAARVHAQAVALLPDPAAALESLGRAAELLGRAMDLTESGNRARFWAEQVTADRAFDPLRKTGRLDPIDPGFGSPKR